MKLLLLALLGVCCLVAHVADGESRAVRGAGAGAGGAQVLVWTQCGLECPATPQQSGNENCEWRGPRGFQRQSLVRPWAKLLVEGLG